jgi:Tol biopolymer transport system component
LVRYDVKSHQFVPYLGGISARSVSFSRDAQWVSYVSYPEGNLWRCRIDGSERLQLTSAPLSVGSSGRWSPDGRQLAFSASAPGTAGRLYLVSAEGGTVRELNVWKDLNVGAVNWSPDGSSILFQDTLNPGASTMHSVDLKTMTTTSVPGLENVIGPVASPDGRYLVATTVLGDALLLFDFVSQKWSDLAKTTVGDLHWSRDSKSIYFDNGYSSQPAVYRVHLTDRTVEQIANLRDFRRVVTPQPDSLPCNLQRNFVQSIHAGKSVQPTAR